MAEEKVENSLILQTQMEMVKWAKQSMICIWNSNAKS